jgi:hypothetical protein
MLQSPSAGDDFKGCLRFRLMPAHNVPLAKDDYGCFNNAHKKRQRNDAGAGRLGLDIFGVMARCDAPGSVYMTLKAIVRCAA